MTQHTTRRSLGILAVAAIFGVAACTDDPVTAPSEDRTEAEELSSLNLDASSEVETTDNHFVVFQGNRVPTDFAASVEALGGSVEISLDDLGAASVSGLDDEGAAQLADIRGVQHVEPELLLHTGPIDQPEVSEGPDAASITATNPAEASFFPRQWHLRAIQADDAWAAGRTGSSSVTVAILDTGIDYQHADLVGLVDLDRSVSFLPTDDAFVQSFFPGAHPIADLHYHGTHVAATVSSNAQAAAGVTSEVTLMGVKVCSITGGCPGAAIFAGLQYAAENDADIINMSLGGAFRKRDFPGYVSVVNRALNEVDRHGVTVVVSAGNAGEDLDHNQDVFNTYCDAPNVVCVSATGPTSGGTTGPWENVDALAVYSNFGRSAIDVAAPGGNTGGAVWAACSSFSVVIPVCQTGTFVVGINGTSMAAPHASGVGALIVEDVGSNRPSQVRNRLHQTADNPGGPGTTKEYGKGRINAAAAVGLGSQERPGRGNGRR